MGVIKWEDMGGGDEYGYFGRSLICVIYKNTVGGQTTSCILNILKAFPGKAADTHRDFDIPSSTQEGAHLIAETILKSWMDEIGFVPKADLDYANEAYSSLHAEYLSRIDQSLEIAKDLRWAQADNDRLKRVLKKIRREIDREANRDIYGRLMKIVIDAHEWAKDTTAKPRTEADFRNADIDANGYVTFRDGGAA
ncbi:hypothetical protein [Rhizobium sp. LCM 4573]|uniref:hypothetical protein n=1 Tax=Rhizobium sp. LCM 4573 TaxID=1848291 RepID=UPI0008D9B3D9|nr:hypothetical protein [Rhizobium sp. LCM 4573]OHV83666.1 hypothetical protein LCM4573_06050 [Rhizobium sp. LCM 4573]